MLVLNEWVQRWLHWVLCTLGVSSKMPEGNLNSVRELTIKMVGEEAVLGTGRAQYVQGKRGGKSVDKV